jgi:hypothetical protein
MFIIIIIIIIIISIIIIIIISWGGMIPIVDQYVAYCTSPGP